LALPPGTPADIVDVHRAAFRKAAADPEFLAQGKAYAPDFSAVSSEDTTDAVRSNGEVSPEVVNVLPNMLRRQGLAF
jgi:tripartite-type tricarboxylate transporter receptor subunit TctC